MMRALLYAEKPSQLPELAGFAEKHGLEAYVLVFGSPDEVKKNSFKAFKRVYVAAAEKPTPDQLAETLVKLYDELRPSLVAAVAAKNNVDAGARLAAWKKIPMFTEATVVELAEDKITVKRQVLGGRAIARISSQLPAIVAIPAGVYSYSGDTGAETVEIEAPEPRIKVTAVEPKKHEAVNIEAAEVVVGVGRGFRKKEDLAMAEELAQILGGVVGGSRPVVADYGWLSEDRWIGISGKKIKPKLYIAIGISGASQHMAATLDSKIIVAINKDKNAPIFQYADYGVVADLYKFLPILIKKLREKLGK
ncbi:electron transfer flavoprotein subunit alpha/FixB family protein [Pyrodictium abyssi]|uniref:Electron transfer flavoprotein subunit alpha/FixB family protein n=1 Tax=Pyrodictium abyssi TaxID=54256 RepID=A0ABM8ISQ0_9CREN|nr:electron transfer flavoprotein subunit alpha/FixB family protein [Pyrodictium abyssi]